MAQQKRPLLGRVSRKPADELLYGDSLPEPGSQEPRKPVTRWEPGKPPGSQVPSSHITREARGVKKATYTLPLAVIESVNKRHAELFTARPGKPPIEKSQIVAAALERALGDDWNEIKPDLSEAE